MMMSNVMRNTMAADLSASYIAYLVSIVLELKANQLLKLYHGENESFFDEMMMRATLY
jgi:hypothetical protein